MPTTNFELADDLRTVANKIPIEQIITMVGTIGTEALMRNVLMLAADLLDLHEEGGVDLNKWTAGMNLVSLLCDGPPFTPKEKKRPPKIIVPSGVNPANVRKLRV